MEIKDVNEYEDDVSLIRNPTPKAATVSLKGLMVLCAFDELNDLTSLHMTNYLDSFKSSSNCMYPLKKHDCSCYYKVLN